MIYKKLLMILTTLGSIIYSGYTEENYDHDTILRSKPSTQKAMEPSFLDYNVISKFISSDPDLEEINSEICLDIATEKKY